MRPKRLRFYAEGASGQAVAFLVAGVVFIASVSALLLESNQIDQSVASTTEETASHAQDGRDLADLLVSSKGVGWAQGADHVRQLGLGAPDHGLSSTNLEKMRGGQLAADPNNDLLDYEEAALGLDLDPDDGTQFHIRLYPVGLAGIYQTLQLEGSRACYVGDWTSLSSVTVSNADPAVMVDDAQTQLDAGQTAQAERERDLVSQIGLAFRDRIHIEEGQPGVDVDMGATQVSITTLVPETMLEGDVFPDDKQYLAQVLPDRLPGCDYLFIGTGVDQNALTSAEVKYGVRDWVEMGGALVVMGSDSQNIQWLRPLFDIGVTTVNGGVYAPDQNHPALNEPHDLQWEDYDNFGYAWDIDPDDADKFQHIIMEGTDDVLAISTKDSFGDGRIFLTTYRPAEIAEAGGMAEALNLLSNLVIYQDRDHLYLEYGPTIEDDVSVRVSARVSSLPDPMLGQTPVRLEVFTWEK